MDKTSNGKVKIFICSHKKFDTYTPTNKDYILLGQSKTIKSDTLAAKYVLDDFTKKHNVCYGELCNIHYLWEHQSIIPQYVGICHYRRFFNDFIEDTSNIPEIIENQGCIVKTPLVTNLEQNKVLRREHSFLFPIQLEQIIRKLFPSYLYAFTKTMKSKYLYNRNMIILKKNDFNEWCNFIFTILDEFDKMNNIIDNDSTTEYVKREINNGRYSVIRRDLNWQNRLQGYLAERLTDTFIRYKFDEQKIYKSPELFINSDNTKTFCIDK